MPFPRASARRLFVSLAALAAGFLFASPARALLGDVNCDGVVNASDAQVLANFLVGISTSVPCPQNADVNGDGQVNVADVLLILQLSKGLRTSFSYQSTSVLAVTPSSGTANILLGAEISAIFSNPVSSASLPGNFTVSDAVSGQISTGTFRCSQNGTISVFTPGVPFLPAHNYIVSLSTGVTDTFGNPISTSVVVDFQTAPLGTMTLTSVNNSTTTLSTLLASPISVQLLTSTGAPAAQVPVVFTAIMGNGTFQPSGVRQVSVLTDSNGNAVLAYKTGTQAIVNTVSISAIGFSTVPIFQVTTTPTPAVNLRLYTGGNQTGGAGSIAPLPLVVQATDAGGDYVQGTTVTFTVPGGQGNFAGQLSSSVVTDSTGTAAVMFNFGSSSGTVIVSASFPGMLGMAPIFRLYDILPTSSTSTYISGNVIDSNTLLPLTSIYVYLTDNPSVWERTDQNGSFLLPTDTGPHVVEVDGFESGLIAGNMYPTVSYPVNAVQGMTTGLGMPAMLPELDQQSYLDVSDVKGGTLTMRSNPQWQLYVAPGQVTFQNGSHTGRLYASFVSHDHIPMPVAGGKTSRFDDTVQPPTVIFNPPAQVTFPNVDGLAPGTVTEIFTLDYVSGAFKRTGRGMVSVDGTIVTSLPGQGITQGGWHLTPNPTPPPAGCVSGTLNTGNGCAWVYLGGPGGQSAPCTPGPGASWNCTLCGLPSGTGPQTLTPTCGLPPGTPPPISPPSSNPPSSCSAPTLSLQPISVQQPIIGVGGTTSVSITVTGQGTASCPLPSSVPVTMTANDPNAAIFVGAPLTILGIPISPPGSPGGMTVNVPVNTTYVAGIYGNAPSNTQVTASITSASGPSSVSAPFAVIQAVLSNPSPATYLGAPGYLCLNFLPSNLPSGFVPSNNTLNISASDGTSSAGLMSSNPDCAQFNLPFEISLQTLADTPCEPSMNISVQLSATQDRLATSPLTIMLPSSSQSNLAPLTPTQRTTAQTACSVGSPAAPYGFNSVWNVTFQSANAAGATPNFNGALVMENNPLESANGLLSSCPSASTFQFANDSSWNIGQSGNPPNGIVDNNKLCVAGSKEFKCTYYFDQSFSMGACEKFTTQRTTFSFDSLGNLTVTRSDNGNAPVTEANP